MKIAVLLHCKKVHAKLLTCYGNKSAAGCLICLGWFSILHLKDLSRLVTKPTKWHVHPAKTQISKGIRPVWSESSLCAWRKLRSLATQWAHSEDSDQTGWMPRLIWVFTGRTVILLVLSRGGSFVGFIGWVYCTHLAIIDASSLSFVYPWCCYNSS